MTNSWSYHRPRRISLSRWGRPAALAVITALAISYVVELNLVSRRGFQARALEQRLVELREENQKFTLKLAELQSLTGLDERVAALGLVPIDQVDYVSVGSAPVARK